MDSLSQLTDPRLVIIFAYAPAGLGHLRVTRALRMGMPKEATPVLLPDPSESIRTLHRFTSNNPIARRILEWSQHGMAETIMAKLYRSFFEHDAWRLEQKLLDVLKQRVELPKTLLIVATHFGIAHRVASIKQSLEHKAKVKVILVVQVTDDSPQKLWYVPNADAIFIPSEETKIHLLRYKRSEHLEYSKIFVCPYPLSPILTQRLSGNELDAKESQADPLTTRRIHIAVPLSGALIGLDYLSSFMQTLHHNNHRFHFHIVGKRTEISRLYFSSWNQKSYATLYESYSDRHIVELYEEAYQETVLLAEITKPSEQAFKAIISPHKRGGAILFFTEPVGRQEYDNLAFLRRHNLIPTEEENNKLYDVLKFHKQQLPPEWSERLSHWRALQLPKDPLQAATFIARLHQTAGFTSMIQCDIPKTSPELADTGTHQFWQTVCSLL